MRLVINHQFSMLQHWETNKQYRRGRRGDIKYLYMRYGNNKRGGVSNSNLFGRDSRCCSWCWDCCYGSDMRLERERW